jgi:hypothetical protein
MGVGGLARRASELACSVVRTRTGIRDRPRPGAVADRQRAWVRKCPGCWAECEVVPNALYSGDLLRAVVARRP